VPYLSLVLQPPQRADLVGQRYRRVDPVAAGQDAPVAAKLVAAISLSLWIGVMYWGRMLPFIGNAF